MIVIDSQGTVQTLWTAKDPLPLGGQPRVVGKRLSDILGEDAYLKCAGVFGGVLESGKGQDHLHSVEFPDGARWFLLRVLPASDAADGSKRLCVQARDITWMKTTMGTLLHSEAILEQAEEIANLGAWELDLATRKITMSPQLLRLLDIDSEDEWTEEMFLGNVYAEEQERIRKVVLEARAEGRSFGITSHYRMRDGKIRIYSIRVVYVRGRDGRPVRAIGVLQDITEQARASDELQQLSQRLIQTRDEERRRTARELHETAGQSLAALKMSLGRLRDSMPKKGSGLASAMLESCFALADEAAREVRTVSYLMHPPLLDEAGLGPALRWYADGFAVRSKIEIKVDVAEGLGRLPQEHETTLFRIVQEALTNVHRYSGSRVAHIRLARNDGYVEAEVRDEGCGLPSLPVRGRREPLGVGIAGMRERVTQLNGTFEIASAAGQGTTIRVVLPVPHSHD
jgi:PAS domain S-box-containing protein